MRSLRISFVVLLSIISGARLFAKNDLAGFLAIHPVWIQEGLSWEQDPGDKQQRWAAGSILYLAKDGKFARLSGTLIKRGPRLALSEGEGEIVHSGTWKAKDGTIQAEYRLVGAYKMLPQAGKEPPSIPGPVQHAEVRSVAQSPMRIEFDGTKFETSSALSTSELKSHLQIYEPTDDSKHPSPK
jgi:hypothetical protein